MRAVGDDHAPLQHDETIHIHDGAQSMRDRDHALADHGFAHGLLDEVLAVAVEGARGFIEQQDGRVAKDRPGDGDSLPLAAGELDATLADQRVIAVLELRYELVRVRPVRSPDDLLGRRPRPAVADVLEEAPVEEARVLRNEGERTAQARLRHVADILPVDADRAGRHVVHPHQQPHESGLARAARADEAQPLTRRNEELEVLDDVPRSALAGVIGKGNALEVDRALFHDQGRGARPVLNRRRHDEGADTLLRRAELLIELRYPLAEVVRGLKERPGERRDHDEITGADDPVHPGIERASHEGEPHQDIHHVLHAAQPHDRAIERHAPVALLARVAPELAILERLVGEEEHVADVRDDIDDAAGHGRAGLVVGRGALGALPAEAEAGHEVDDDAHRGGGAEHRVRHIEKSRDEDEEHAARDEVEHHHVEQQQHLVREQHRPVRDLSRERALEVRGRETLRVAEDLLLDAHEHRRARVVRAEPHRAIEREAPDYEGDEQKQGSEEHRARLGGRIVHREHGVGEALGGVGDRGEHGAPEDRQREQAHTAPEELPEEMEGEGQKTVGQSRGAGLLPGSSLRSQKVHSRPMADASWAAAPCSGQSPRG